MNRKFATTTLCLGGFALLITGCLTSTGGQADAIKHQSAPVTASMRTSPSPKTPGAPGPKTPGAPAPQLPGAPSPKLPTAPLPNATANAAVVPAANPVSQVGFLSPRCGCGACTTGRGACLQCNAGCEPTQPGGYLQFTPAGWNAYGIDPQEFLCDGGDQPPRARLLNNESMSGLEVEDTVVHYTSEAGDIHVQPSNRACLYSPRFASVRKISSAAGGQHVVALANMDLPVGTTGIGTNQPGLTVRDSQGLSHADVAKRIDAIRDRNRGVPVESVLVPIEAGKVLDVLATLAPTELGKLTADQLALVKQAADAATTWTMRESVEVAIEDLKTPVLTRDQKIEGFTVYDFPEAGRLRIAKLADRADAQPGESVTFTIRIENVGDSAVNHVVLMDNLVTRLEYVNDSQACTVDAEFKAIDNSEQSARLEWKLTDELKVGEVATVTFKCLVR